MKKHFLNNSLNNLLNNLKIIPIVAFTCFIILNLYIGYNLYKKDNINSSVIRLHVVANSNSISDQILKLKVNEKIEKYIIDSIDKKNNLSNKDILNKIKENSNEILKITNDTLRENNKNYSSTLEVGKIKYDEKESMLIHMDKGTYNSARLILGSGNGKNIWSFIFPDEENISKLQNYETIMPNISKMYQDNKQSNIEYKSKILEIIKNIK